ncbi:sigma factor-like helix-turn-helix DNA-binding protein [Neolewinella antarctica]|uniref:DNA-directed RNA polymerase specialized sigma24 family protein n=1 Tax=Neolewinella antarctica TaxID=442734 RepID=A0ABX0XC21_9BACT|nr:sigma factor-like helix-turn-helix DNA-binding protein [Neolewinella antarctica]NJC26800.1 DNA-directed RNA polymerase specialized sigma24 family protein [Neolewinella antarctica]
MKKVEPQEVSRYWSKLPKTHADALLLYLNGNSYQDVSDELEIPVGTVKSRIFSARMILKRAVVEMLTGDKAPGSA